MRGDVPDLEEDRWYSLSPSSVRDAVLLRSLLLPFRSLLPLVRSLLLRRRWESRSRLSPCLLFEDEDGFLSVEERFLLSSLLDDRFFSTEVLLELCRAGGDLTARESAATGVSSSDASKGSAEGDACTWVPPQGRVAAGAPNAITPMSTTAGWRSLLLWCANNARCWAISRLCLEFGGGSRRGWRRP